MHKHQLQFCFTKLECVQHTARARVSHLHCLPEEVGCPDNGEVLGVHPRLNAMCGDAGQVPHEVLSGAVVWRWQLLNHVVDTQKLVVFILHRLLKIFNP